MDQAELYYIYILYLHEEFNRSLADEINFKKCKILTDAQETATRALLGDTRSNGHLENETNR